MKERGGRAMVGREGATTLDEKEEVSLSAIESSLSTDVSSPWFSFGFLPKLKYKLSSLSLSFSLFLSFHFLFFAPFLLPFSFFFLTFRLTLKKKTQKNLKTWDVGDPMSPIIIIFFLLSF